MIALRIAGFSLAALVVTTPAWSAPTAEEAEAKTLDASAAKLAKAGATQEAMAALSRSMKLAPKAATLRRIGSLQQEMKQFGAAYRTLSEFATRFPDASKADRAAVDKQLDELRAITGSVRVTAAAGVHVELDGAPFGDGPLDAPLRVNIGPHAVRATQEGYDPFEAKVDVVAGAEVVVTAAPVKRMGTLTVSVRGAYNELKIDGKPVPARAFRGQVPAGPHELELVCLSSKGAPRVVKRRVEVGSGAAVDVELEGEMRGTLIVHAPPQTLVLLDGVAVGSGEWSAQVAPGPHELAILDGEVTLARIHVDAIGPGETHDETIARPAPPPRRGWYGQLDAMFAASPVAHNFVTDACALRTDCTGSDSAYGVGVLGHVGYSFGWFGVEAIAAFRYDQSGESVTTGPSFITPGGTFTADFTVHRASFVDGLGVRFMPDTQPVRFSAGWGLAYMTQLVASSSTITNGEGFNENAVGTAPMMLFDVGILLGKTPGTKFHAALVTTLEFDGDPLVTPDHPTQVLSRGTNVFVGPALGLQFGR